MFRKLSLVPSNVIRSRRSFSFLSKIGSTVTNFLSPKPVAKPPLIPMPGLVGGGLMGIVLQKLILNFTKVFLKQMEELQIDANNVVEIALFAMNSDPRALQLFGNNIQALNVISSSTSSSSINGVQKSEVHLIVAVSGDRNQGIATIRAKKGKESIVQLKEIKIQDQYRTIEYPVNLSRQGQQGQVIDVKDKSSNFFS